MAVSPERFSNRTKFKIAPPENCGRDCAAVVVGCSKLVPSRAFGKGGSSGGRRVDRRSRRPDRKAEKQSVHGYLRQPARAPKLFSAAN
jgi:hypothetical protein